MDAGSKLAQSQRMGMKVAQVYQKRVQKAQEQLQQRLQQVAHDAGTEVPATVDPLGGYRYAVDATQRSLLFWATLWQRGTNFVEHNAQGLKPVLHFDYEFVIDGRQLERPVNYALLSITPPEGVTVDAKRRPYVIIDPRAGHGPGIGGFKDDSQVGVALRAGHPVYFVIFFRDPEPGQTLLDVCSA
jgi:hypothetical protein